ncbi:MAG: [protein-PII] uridylyltransferase [Deltaproteobacteria bacterium]|jgi:[protein-PII] uridylyltransferase|nr:[protein-PII] uridylyltransferase [Deltaproteobacteria bacterium]
MAIHPNVVRRLKYLRENFTRECRSDIPGLLAARTYSSHLREALGNAPDENAPCQGWALLAVGGIGRGELSFASDIDLLFLYKKRLPPQLSEFVHDLVYGLWDSGFEVGHATASVSMVRNMVQNDFSILTNYLEAGFIAGDAEFFNDWKGSFLKLFGNTGKRRFLEHLTAYREERLRQFGESAYLLEPNVKDGVGALRDLHTIRWAGIVYLQDPSHEAMLGHGWLTEPEKLWLDQSYDFLWRVRLQLHQLGGRRQDRLLFPEQELIAKRMGCMAGAEGSAVEAFMRLYYRNTSRVSRTTSFFLEKLGESKSKFPGFRPRRRILPGPFLLEGKHLHFMDPEWVGKDPLLLMRFFWQAARSGAHFHHNSGRIIRENLGGFQERERRNPEAIRQFFDILLDPRYSFTVLNTMLETGFLQTFIPEFSGVRYKVQDDVYHVYTVDEHLLRTVRELHLIEAGELEGEGPLKSGAVLMSSEERRILYLAGLLHDIGKGGGKNHSIRGAGLAGEIATRMGLDEEQKSLLCFLIEQHLILAETALKRDLMDEKPIARCAVTIKDRRRLLLLYLLTIADSRATGTAAWNEWKASLLRELFFKVDRLLMRPDLQPENIEARTLKTQEKVMSLLADPAESEKIAEWMETLSFRYLLSQQPADILKHYGMEKELAGRPVCFRAEPVEGEMWQTTVMMRDRPGLFALITGVLWVRGLNILSADIFTRESGVVCDILRVERIPDPLHPGELWGRVEADLARVLRNSSYLDEILDERRRPSVLETRRHPRKEDRVIVDEDASDFYTLIEVYTWDRPGVLHAITKGLFELDLNIQLAKISTPGAQVADVFYVTDLSGEKLMSYDMHERVREKLLSCLAAV